jgi:hypothetical protein
VKDLLIRELGHENSHRDGFSLVIGDSETETSNPIKTAIEPTASTSKADFKAIAIGDQSWFF